MSEHSHKLFISPPKDATIEECFHFMLPDNLYHNHYVLSQIYPQFTPDEWRKYLKSQDRWIMNEVAAITEASSREALSRLGSGELKAGDAGAIKQLLDRSEQLNAQSQDKRTFTVLQFDPSHSQEPKTKLQEYMEKSNENYRNVQKFYNTEVLTNYRAFSQREADGEVYRNADGTVHFPDPNTTTENDRTYLRLFNPDNQKVPNIPQHIKEEGEQDWQ